MNRNLFILPLCIIIIVLESCGTELLLREKTDPIIDPAVYSIPGEAVTVWIRLSDKGVFSESDLVKALSGVDIPERTLNRRAKNGAGVNFGDLPLLEKHIEGISGLTLNIRQQSKWLNAVSAVVEKKALPDLAALPYVIEIRPVAKGKIADYENWDTEVYWQGLDGYDYSREELGQEGAFYGVSYDQLDQMGVIEAHRRGYYGDGVIVAVLDGGFMTDHRSLLHAEVIDEWDFIFNDDNTNYDPAQDIKGQPRHGTSCMSCIAAYDPGNMIGGAPFAGFILGKTEDIRSETAAEEDYWVAAVEWAEIQGADVLSSSLSYLDWYSQGEFDGVTPLCSRASTRAFNLGMVVCTSMGNSGPRPTTMGTPADAEGNVTVGAADSLGLVTRFSSRGPTADGRIKPNILALGRHVTIIRPYTWDGYGLANGTSFACPLAAGAIALLVQAHPGWSSWDILEAVENTATRADRPDNSYGYGIIQIDQALDYPSISGYITNRRDHRPVPGAKVLITSGKLAGTYPADEDGFYKIVNLPDGSYRIKVQAEGYRDSEERELAAPPDEISDFSLEPMN